MDRWINRWMNEWIDGWVREVIDGRWITDGWVDE
jgi:hypothetical protein